MSPEMYPFLNLHCCFEKTISKCSKIWKCMSSSKKVIFLVYNYTFEPWFLLWAGTVLANLSGKWEFQEMTDSRLLKLKTKQNFLWQYSMSHNYSHVALLGSQWNYVFTHSASRKRIKKELLLACLTLSWVILKNDQTYFENLTLWTLEDFESMSAHFSTLSIKWIKVPLSSMK